VKRRWDEIKARRSPREGPARWDSRALPGLVEAQQIASRAAGAGFDWESIEQVFEKLDEEVNELREATRPTPSRTKSVTCYSSSSTLRDS